MRPKRPIRSCRRPSPLRRARVIGRTTAARLKCTRSPPASSTSSPQPSPSAPTSAPPSGPRHGYYKLFAVRQADRTAKVYLQQIAQTDNGPDIVSTVELQELNDLNPYVTDIRPENSTGRLNEPGLFAMVYLKTDPDGDATVGRSQSTSSATSASRNPATERSQKRPQTGAFFMLSADH
jgi:hypothetical protein